MQSNAVKRGQVRQMQTQRFRWYRESRVKWIDIHGIGFAIVMQNENGPCPLLAVVNVLLLRGQISLPHGSTQVDENHLLLLDITECELANYEQNIEDVLTLIPSLPRGLDVNIHFTGCVLALGTLYHI
ncbi:unnamed protein product [Gongylonema pulchrum]|uniref:Ubiquitin carboxyl-terminal hydrolase n=1 Tax=Gongylonema pulchrum TaxID=637853 RepID=A0A183D7H7_9BILA|nr:unnamed protein product [Gongylonema pulchrum]